MSQLSRTVFGWWAAATVLVSAFLLFQVQPVISKIILPWFGGSPAVWTTCMLFFQMLLLGGYAYAHFVATYPKRGLAIGVHVVLLIAAVAVLPILPSADWKPEDSSQPTWRILSLLTVNIGLPYLALAATGPLIQAWYSWVMVGNSPYRLYALSNVGSLGALLTYPFLFEPWLTTTVQAYAWSWLFCGFALLCGVLAAMAYRNRAGAARLDELPEGFKPVKILAEQKIAWFCLPALASVMLLAITHHVCQDVAVIPFLWVAPLSLYLLSFIICFDREVWYRRRIFSILTLIAVMLLAVVMLDNPIEDGLERLNIEIDISDYFREFQVEASVYLVTLFLICMVCHGELVQLKPPPRHLTQFYLMVAAGGAFGGVFVGLACPQIFTMINALVPIPVRFEMNLGLVLTFMLATGVLWDESCQVSWLKSKFARASLIGLSFALLLVVVRAQFEDVETDALVTKRNFYGSLTVEEFMPDSAAYHIRELVNGRILHGSQFMNEEKRTRPTSYYNILSGIGVALMNYPSSDPIRVGVVGLGTGTIACYGQSGDQYTFYEINPAVIELANDQFYYLSDSQADCRTVLGDARISMERQDPQNFDIIVLDAFSGDAIPVHLLTKEAFEQYLRHLNEFGIVVIHISNRHLDLSPVVGGLAEHFKMEIRTVDFHDDDEYAGASSEWVMITRNDIFLQKSSVAEYVDMLEYDPIPLWTDQYSNLLQIIR